MSEIREIPGHEGYGITVDGRVYSRRRVKKRKSVLVDEWRELRPRIDRGYPKACMSFIDRTVREYVHRLVLLTFVGPCPDGMECCHDDGDRSNCHLSNLRWDTRLSNARDQFRHDKVQFGERNHKARLKSADIPVIRKLWGEGMLQKDIAALFGVSRWTINNVCTGRKWASVT